MSLKEKAEKIKAVRINSCEKCKDVDLAIAELKKKLAIRFDSDNIKMLVTEYDNVEEIINEIFGEVKK